MLLARAGDRSAFAELWQRHARSGIRVARQFTSSIDADDLVSEAYARIYQRVLAGGGPEGAFRPYLYTTIRNLAARWGRGNHDVNVDDIGDFSDPDAVEDPATVALDHTLTVRAFRSLPERWQTVLWYTEVEGMDPHEVAPLLGMSANGVAALSYRAREGLRKAWLQAHVSEASASGECAWTIARLGDYARNGLGTRERLRVSDHLATCPKCTIISEEVEEVGSRLALVLLPLLLGGAVGGSLLAAGAVGAHGAGAAVAAAHIAAPAMPPAFGALATAGATATPVVTAGLGIGALTAPLVGTVAAALVISGGLAVTSSTPAPPAPPVAYVAVAAPSSAGGAVPGTPMGAPAAPGGALPGAEGPGSVGSSGSSGTSGSQSVVGSTLNGVIPGSGDAVGGVLSGVGDTVNGAVNGVGDTVDGLVHDVTNPINTLIPGLDVGPGPVPDHTAPDGLVGATASLDLSGKGMPGATVSVQAAGVVYATTVVTPQGTWAIHISALPDGLGKLQLKQTLINLLGIDLVSVPLNVLSNSLGITLNILGL